MRTGLEALSDQLSTRYLQIAKASLARAIRYAEAHDLSGGTWRRSSIRLRVRSDGRAGR